MKKVFIGGLPKSVTDEKLKETFGRYGDIVDYVVMKDPYTRESRGFGFVEFSSEEPVNEIIKSRPHSIDGREIEVRRAMPKDNTHSTIHERTRRIFIGGLNYDVTEEALLNYYTEKFSMYGRVEAVEVKRDHETNQSRGFGFITFDTEDTADVALILESKPTQFGRNCEIKKSEPRKVLERSSHRNVSHRNGNGRYGQSPPRRRNNYDDYRRSPPQPPPRDYYRQQRTARCDREPYPPPPSDFYTRYEQNGTPQRDRHYHGNGNYYESGYSRQYYDTQVPTDPRSYNSSHIPNEYSRPASARFQNLSTSRTSGYPTRTNGPLSTPSRQYNSGYRFNDS